MILDKVVDKVRQSLADRKQQVPLSELERLSNCSESPRGFTRALQGTDIKLIAEVKRASPSKGWLCPNLDVSTLVRSYARGGAAAISVLTESSFFKGSFADLASVRQTVDLPVLCKDFILDPYQIYEARAYGADAILLIVAILSPLELSLLVEVAHSLKVSALIEVHNEQEIEKAIGVGGNLIGINNRDLTDFSIDLGVTLRLLPLIPPGTIVISESGIKSAADIATLQASGVNAVLVGETLITSSDPEAKLKELRGELALKDR